MAGNLDDNKEVVDGVLQRLPTSSTRITRTATYGSWFNFYLCDFDRAGDPLQHGHLHAELPLVGREVQLMLRKVPARRAAASTPFRERNPVVIGAVGLAVIAAMLLLAFNIDDSRCSPGRSHSAALHRGRRPQGRRRRADRRRQGRQGHRPSTSTATTCGSTSGSAGPPTSARRPSATVRIKTILGQKFLAARAGGQGRARPRRSRCPGPTPAYDVVEAFSDLATTTEDDRHRRSSRPRWTPSPTRSGTRPRRSGPPSTGSVGCPGRSRPATTQLRELLDHANGVTGVLADRNEELVTLLADGDLLLQELRKRRDDIHTLLVSTVTLSQQLTGLVRDNRAAIGPALTNLKNVLATLRGQPGRTSTAASELLAPFVRVFANTTGNGRWFDTYIQNLVPVPGRTGERRHEPPARSSRAVSRCSSWSRSPCVLWPGGGTSARPGRVRPRRRALPGLGRADPRRQGRQGHRGHAARRPGRGRHRRTTTSTRSRPTPRPSSCRRRSSATATSSSRRSTTAGPRWPTAPASSWPTPRCRSSWTGSSPASTT